MVHSYFGSKRTQPDLDSTNSSDCENSEDRLDSIISSLLANLSVYTPEHEDEMTIKKYKKDRSKHERISENEKSERGPSRHSVNHYNNYGATATDSNSHFNTSRRHCSIENHILSCSNSDLRLYNYDSQPSLPKRPRSLLPTDCISTKNADRGSKVSDTFTENSGNNSEDEYYMATGSRSQVPFQVEESEMSKLLKEKKGWKIIIVGADGACLFRAVAHQIFGDEEKHMMIREQVINYMKQNREHFSQFISEDFDHYLLRKLNPHTHGNHVEIQAISELYNRPVEIYHNSLEPINVFHREYTDLPPLRLSYHGGIHYNSIVDPQNPTFGEGLGMPNCQPRLSEPELMEKAKLESEKSHIEESLFKNDLQQSEDQEIERSITEQVAKESYLEYLKYLSSQNKKPEHDSKVAIVSNMEHANRRKFVSATTSTASCSYSDRRSPLRDSLKSDDSLLRHIPENMLEMDEDSILAMVLENSRKEYQASNSKESTFGPFF